MHPLESRLPHVQAIADHFHLGPAETSTLESAYRTVREVFGPVVTSAVEAMLDDFRRRVTTDPDHRVVFLGRDGHALAGALRGLDAEFFGRHCSEVVLSRRLVEDALQDAEYTLGLETAAVAGFRKGARKPPEQVAGSARKLTRYLRSAGVPVGRPDSALTLVDNGFKGTIQELLSVLYPRTRFQGAYMTYLGVADDPHPGTKRGYLVHLPGGDGNPFSHLPADPAFTFANLDGVRAYENILGGPLTSAVRVVGNAPVQGPQGRLPMHWSGLTSVNPLLVDDRFRSPGTRDAVKAVAWLATHDHARAHAVSGASRESLTAERAAATRQVHTWIAGSGPVEPELRSLLDSFTPREDWPLVRRLYSELARARLPAAAVRPWWEIMASTASLERKSSLVDAATADLRSPEGRERWARRATRQGIPIEAAESTAAPSAMTAVIGWQRAAVAPVTPSRSARRGSQAHRAGAAEAVPRPAPKAAATRVSARNVAQPSRAPSGQRQAEHVAAVISAAFTSAAAGLTTKPANKPGASPGSLPPAAVNTRRQLDAVPGISPYKSGGRPRPSRGKGL
jgi:hypothetical protein